MMYLSHEKYKEYGGLLDSATYFPLERIAEREIDNCTFNRIKTEFDGSQAYTEDLGMLVLWLVENPLSDKIVNSESTDGVSTSYNILAYSDREKLRLKQIFTMLGNYRNNTATPLLYRGVSQ